MKLIYAKIVINYKERAGELAGKFCGPISAQCASRQRARSLLAGLFNTGLEIVFMNGGYGD